MKKHVLFKIYLLIFILYNSSCKNQNPPISNNVTKLINCYILKPILKNKEFEGLDKLSYLDTNMVDFIKKYPFARKKIKIDDSIGYITSFEYQKRILINEHCFSNLTLPDSIDLSDIYFSSRFNTSLRTGLKIQFLNSYKKNILNLGNVQIFEYYVPYLSTVEAKIFHIIVFNQPNREEGDDFEGIVINSDGLDWKEINLKGEVIPIHLTNLRGEMQIKIPLIFDGSQFLPIGYFRGTQ